MALILKKIIIIGGNAAGMSAATRARRNDPKAQIIVYEKGDYVSYASCGLPYFIAGIIKQPQELLAVPPEAFHTDYNITIKFRHEAISFDPRQKTIKILDLQQNRTITQLYDRMIIAAGAHPVVPEIPGNRREQCFTLHSVNDGIRLRDFIENQRPGQAVIAGAGYIGLEMAEALRARDISVTLIEQKQQLLPYIDADMAAVVEKEIRANACMLLTSASIKEVVGEKSVTGVQLMDGRMIPCDMIIWATGIKPNVEFALTGSVQTGRSGAIQVTPRMQTNLMGVYAAGDCAEVKNRATNKNEHIPLATTASKQGRTAADNATGKIAHFQGVVATSLMKVFRLEIGRVGLTSDYAESLRLPFRSIVVTGDQRAKYYPGNSEVTVKLIFKVPDGRLLGGQIIGKQGSGKSIDVLALAIQQKMTVAQLAEQDFAYTPPAAPLWDALLIASNQAVKQLKR
jgi:NADPH-dependent 2,4-dienoyl-CoA reductase/sulfur reductase-like enzyme